MFPQKGDIILVNSPVYDVKKCKGRVIDINERHDYIEINVLDGSFFDHDNFQRFHRHILMPTDTWSYFKDNSFDDALFEL